MNRTVSLLTFSNFVGFAYSGGGAFVRGSALITNFTDKILYLDCIETESTSEKTMIIIIMMLTSSFICCFNSFVKHCFSSFSYSYSNISIFVHHLYPGALNQRNARITNFCENKE